MDKILSKAIQILKDKKLTISFCESATGGYLSSMFTQVPGISQIFKGSLVTYCNEAKVVLAGVKADTIVHHSAISDQTADEMATNTAKLLNTDIALSVTGNAGPDPSENRPVGMFFIGVSVLGITNTYELLLQPSFSRKKMIQKTANYAVEVLLKTLLA